MAEEQGEPAWFQRFTDYYYRDPKDERMAIGEAFEAVARVFSRVAETFAPGKTFDRPPGKRADDTVIEIQRRQPNQRSTLTATRHGFEEISFKVDGHERPERLRYNHDTGKVGLFAPLGESITYPTDRRPMDAETQDELEDDVDVEEYAGSLALEWARARGFIQN